MLESVDCFKIELDRYLPSIGFMVIVVGLGSQEKEEDPEFKSCFAIELITGGVDSACHPSKGSKMSSSLLG